MTMYKELHPRNDVAKIYGARKKRGRRLISYAEEENNLIWYVSDEIMMRKVEVLGMVNTEAAVRPSEHKRIKK